MFLDEASGLLRHADETARTARQRASGHGREAAARKCRRCDPGRASTRDRGLRSAPSRDRDRPEPAPARRALEDVRNGRLDIALVGLPAPATGLNVTPLAVERIVAAVSDRHP